MAEEETRRYPKGFRFDPFDQELITDYLKPMIMGKLSCDFIKIRQVYGDGPSSNPWLVFPNHDQSWFFSPHLKDTEKCMFVFTKLSKRSRSTTTSTSSKRAGSRKAGCVTAENTSKKAGCGTWDGKTPRKQIRDGENNVIGEKRYLVFEINEVDSGVSGFDWRKVGLFKMHEYSLSGINGGLDSAHSIVLCKITYDSAKACPINLKSGTKNQINCPINLSHEAPENQVIVNKNLEATSSVTAENKQVIINENLEATSNVTEENLNAGLDDWSATELLQELDACPINLSHEAPEKQVIINKNLEATSNVTAENKQVIINENLEATSNVTEENLNAIHGGHDDRSDATELLRELDAFCGDFGFDDLGSESFCLGDFDFGLDLDDGSPSFDGLGDVGQCCFDVDWIMGHLDSYPQEGPIEYNSISNLGKRKFDAEESSCRNKKTCL